MFHYAHHELLYIRVGVEYQNGFIVSDVAAFCIFKCVLEWQPGAGMIG